jgi:hypothetical protein
MPVKRSPADIAFSKAIRESHDYTCCHCDRNYRHDIGYAHCSHVHTRKHRSTRWNANFGAVCLCAKCHRRFTDFPVEWGTFLRGYMGDSNYEEAKRLAWESRKYTKAEQKEIAAHYRAEEQRIKQLRLDGEQGFIPIVSYD